MSSAAPRAAGIDRGIRVFDRVVRTALGAAFAGILVAALVQVASRYVPGVSVIGIDEVARFLMIGTAFLAIPLLTLSRLQIAVDALAHYLPQGLPKLWLHRVVLVVEGIFYVVFANYAWFVFLDYNQTRQTTTSLNIPLSIPTVLMVIGAALGAIAASVLIVRTFVVPADYAGIANDAPMTTGEGNA